LVSYSSTITMMHGPIYIRTPTVFGGEYRAQFIWHFESKQLHLETEYELFSIVFHLFLYMLTSQEEDDASVSTKSHIMLHLYIHCLLTLYITAFTRHITCINIHKLSILPTECTYIFIHKIAVIFPSSSINHLVFVVQMQFGIQVFWDVLCHGWVATGISEV